MFARMLAGTCLLATVVMTSCASQAADVESEIGLQMYTLHNLGSAEEQFAMAHNAGFKNVEIVGTHNLNSEKMNTILDKNQLKVTSAHVQLSELENNYQDTVMYNKAIGNSTIIIPWIEPEDRPKNSQGWIHYAKRLDTLGEKLHKDGIVLGYHNHNFEMKKYDGVTALEIIMNYTQPNNLKLEMDAAWVSRGGQDPVYFLNKYPGRIYAIHAKDNAAIGVRDDEMNFAPLGEGLLDWKSILPAAKASGVRWFIIEHDKPKDPWSIITTAHRNLQAELSKLSN